MPLGTLRPSPRTLLCGLIACLAMFVLLGTAGSAPAQAAPAPMSALLLTSSVTDDPVNDPPTQSLEYQQAVADGYTVTPVDDLTWEHMSTADFATYQLIIIGDQATGCADVGGSTSVPGSTASVWEPAVMGSGGNKVLIGTDPSRHYHLGKAPSAPQLEQNGLAYAGAASGATGVYLDLGCSFDNAPAGADAPVLDGLTSGTGKFAVEGFNDPSLPSGQACASDVNIVASTGPTSGLTDADLSNWDCSVHEAFTSFPSDYTPLALAPAASSGFPSEYCADDLESGEQACGAPYILVSGGGVKVSSDVTLSPASQDVTTSPESPGSGTVTATVTASGSYTPLSGQLVMFSVYSGPDKGQTYTGTTDSNGQTTFTFNNDGLPGTDAISASFTNLNGNTEKSLATIAFNGPNPVSATAQNLSGTEQTSLGDPTVATFADPSGGINANGWNAQISWGDGTPTTSGTVTPTGTPNQYDVNADHTYATPNTSTVTVTITDAGDTADTTTVTSTATISTGNLSVSAQSFSSPTEGTSTGNTTVATFTSTDAAPAASTYTATVDWGDGTTTAGTITAVSGTPGSFTVSGNHNYAEAGTYTVKTTVTGGDDPNTNASGQATITVQEAPISVTPGTITSTAGKVFSGQVATFTDGDTQTPLSDYTATIGWGDGSTTPGTISGSNGSFSVNGNHNYAAPGTQPLTVTVSENDGDTATGTGSATTTGVAPSTVAGLTLPGTISAKKFLCTAKHARKCPGVPILGVFRGSGTAAWNVSISRSGKHSVALGTITRTVSAGSTKLVFKVTNRRQAKRLYKLVKKHRLNRLSVKQQFTNVAGGSSQTSLYTRVTR